MFVGTLAALPAHLFAPGSPARQAGRINLLAAGLLSPCLVFLRQALSRAPDRGRSPTGVPGPLIAAVVGLVARIIAELRPARPRVVTRRPRRPVAARRDGAVGP